MSRPNRLFFLVPLFACSLSFVGCGTMYDDMYSPRRTYFKPDPEKPKTLAPTELPPEMIAPPTGLPAGDTTPLNPSPSTGVAAPPPPPELEAGTPGDAIPGMEPIPGM
jgi:hypothetical protein